MSIKSPTDLVRIKNVSSNGTNKYGFEYKKRDIIFTFSSNEYVVPKDGYIDVPRVVADHALRKGYSHANEVRELEIEELPEDLRNPLVRGNVDINELEVLRKLNAELQAQLAAKSEQGVDVGAVEEEKGEDGEPKRGRGRPKGS
jgi:hypothetical protein